MRDHEKIKAARRGAVIKMLTALAAAFALLIINPALARAESAGEITVAAFQITYNHAGHRLKHYEQDFFKKLHTLGRVRVLEGAGLKDFMQQNISQPSIYYWLNLIEKGYIEPFREFQSKGVDHLAVFVMTAQEKSLMIEVYDIDTEKLTAAKFKEVEYLYPGDRRSLTGFHNVYQSVKKKFYEHFEGEVLGAPSARR